MHLVVVPSLVYRSQSLSRGEGTSTASAWVDPPLIISAHGCEVASGGKPSDCRVSCLGHHLAEFGKRMPTKPQWHQQW